MARKNRYFTTGSRWHVTHRCHDRQFLLKYAKDKDTYQEQLRCLAPDFQVSVLAYCLTSNHVHLFLTSQESDGIPGLMKKLAGEFAQGYNRRKDRSGAFWGDRYHATLVDSGDYAWKCLQYIDLNMVRAGVVDHPSNWKWCSYRELVGQKKRYRIVDMDAIRNCFPNKTLNQFQNDYRNSISAKIQRQELEREPYWSTSLAVGSDEFVKSVGKTIINRSRLIYETNATAEVHLVREGA